MECSQYSKRAEPVLEVPVIGRMSVRVMMPESAVGRKGECEVEVVVRQTRAHARRVPGGAPLSTPQPHRVGPLTPARTARSPSHKLRFYFKTRRRLEGRVLSAVLLPQLTWHIRLESTEVPYCPLMYRTIFQIDLI